MSGVSARSFKTTEHQSSRIPPLFPAYLGEGKRINVASTSRPTGGVSRRLAFLETCPKMKWFMI